MLIEKIMIPIQNEKQGFAPLTIIILLINLAVFTQELRIGKAMFDIYGAVPLEIYDFATSGSGNIYWSQLKILISGFMHGGFLHLFGNMLFLMVFGPAVEKALGPLIFLASYIAAIYIGFYSHMAITPQSSAPLIGASGAISAIMGTYLIFCPRARISTIVPLFFTIKVIEIPSFLFIMGWFILQGVNGYLSAANPTEVAWFAHIGGFLLGIILGIHFRWFS